MADRLSVRNTGPNRREAMRLGLGLFAAPAFIPRFVSSAPSERVRHASFGAGGMAGADLSAIASHKDVDFVAVADIDTKRALALKERFPNLKIYKDYRVLLAELGEKDLDSVNVSTSADSRAA